MKVYRHLSVIVALIGCLLLFNFSTIGTAQTTQLRMGIVGDEGTINPYTYVTGNPGWNLLLLQYDTLYQLDADGVPQPWLVANSEISDDGLTVSLSLREDVSFHDGEAFTAEDVAFTVNYFKENTQGRFTRALNPIESATVTDTYTLDLQLTAPTPSLELGVFSDVPILPEHVWSEIENPAEESSDISLNIGSGPYRLVEYQPDQFYRFEAFEGYFAGTPNVPELVFIRYADNTGSLAALQSNEVDMLVNSVAPEQVDFLSMSSDISVVQGPLFTTQMVNYDIERAPFDQLDVRRAMSLAIDRQDIIDTVYLGAATAGNPGWIHPQSTFFNANIETLHDPDVANTLLDDAGFLDSDGDGIREFDGEAMSFSFIMPSNNALRIRIAELVREMLLEIGIDAMVEVVEQATWEDAVWPGFSVSQGRNYDMAMWGWSAPIQAD
ncbi:MAG: ABC transporter substrate-binding protein, partial [Chloroflexota bacterium]